MKLQSIRTKLTISSAVVIATMILLIEVCIYQFAVRQQINDSGKLYSELADTTGKSFDDMYLSFKRAVDFLTMNEELQECLVESAYAGDEWGEMNVYLKKLLTDRALLMNEINGLYLYGHDGVLRTYWRKQNRPDNEFIVFQKMDEAWFQPSGKVTGRMLGGHLVFTRKIRSINNLETVGYLLAIYDERELNERVEGVIANPVSSLVVFDSFGEVMTHNIREEDRLEKIMDVIDFSDTGRWHISKPMGMGKVMTAQYVSKSTGWRIVSFADVKQITRSSDTIRTLVLWLGGIGILIGILIQWIISFKIVGPLKQMVLVVHHAEEGDYSSRMQLETHDELEILADAFNHMMEKTDVLVNTVLRDEIKYRDAQLALLQAQINPHLLYNTLECINWLAEFDRKEDIRRVTIAFSNLMKSLTSGDKIIKIKDELRYIDDFLRIYKILLGGKLEYHIEVDEQLKEVMIPRLMIQPLVENAVVHGIKKSLDGGRINVNISRTDKGLLISILDDGLGMEAEQAERILRYAKENCTAKEKEGVGLGLQNVIDRLRIVYQGNAKFSISSNMGWGTVIDIFIPENWGGIE